MIEVWLVRHAQSENNAASEAERQPDPALTALGHWQATALAEYLRESGETFARRSVSAFRRALQTAAPLHTVVSSRTESLVQSQAQPNAVESLAVSTPAASPTVASPPIAGFEIWREIHEVGGCYLGHPQQPMHAVPGLSREEVEREFPWAIPQADWKTGGWNELPGHETRVQAIPRADRVRQTLQEAAAQMAANAGSAPEPQRWLLVSHGEFIALLLSRCLTGREDYFVRPRSLYNTSITKLLLTPEHCRLLEFNQIAHLSPAAISS